MKLNEIASKPGSMKSRKRICRGIGSGVGKTGGRGVKGQKSRTGVAIAGFEGGQMPIYMRLPKRGFNVPNAKKLNIVSLRRVQTAIDAGKLDGKATITVETLKEAGVLNQLKDGVRLLSDGELKAKVNFEIGGASKSAVSAVEKAGGKVTIIGA
ncbi:MAG: 50S ribosomal protein L15 [Hyphomicrobiales bacterium]